MLGFTHLPEDVQAVIQDRALMAIDALTAYGCTCPAPRVVSAHPVDGSGECIDERCASPQPIFAVTFFTDEVILGCDLRYVGVGFSFAHDPGCQMPAILAAPLN